MPTVHGPPSRMKDKVGERFVHVRRQSRGELREAVSARGGDRHSGGANQLERHRVVGHAQSHGRQSGGDGVRNHCFLGKHQSQRAGPVMVSQYFGGRGPVRNQPARHLNGIDVDDQGAGARPAFRSKNALDGLRVERIGA